jgi:hypothetical protein
MGKAASGGLLIDLVDGEEDEAGTDGWLVVRRGGQRAG